MTHHTLHHRLLFSVLLCAAVACSPKLEHVTVPPEWRTLLGHLQKAPNATAGPKVLAIVGPVALAALHQAGAEPFYGDDAEAMVLARDATTLIAGMEHAGADYLLTPEPDLRDVSQLPTDKLRIVPSVLHHLQTLYGTGTRDQACVDRLQLVAALPTIREVGGRHLPAALLFRRVPGALLQMHKLVPGIPVRVETSRTIAGQVFVFDCQARADGRGELSMRFPYATLPDTRVLMWTAMTKAGDPIRITEEDVVQGRTVDLTQ